MMSEREIDIVTRCPNCGGSYTEIDVGCPFCHHLTGGDNFTRSANPSPRERGMNWKRLPAKQVPADEYELKIGDMCTVSARWYPDHATWWLYVHCTGGHHRPGNVDTPPFASAVGAAVTRLEDVLRELRKIQASQQVAFPPAVDPGDAVAEAIAEDA